MPIKSFKPITPSLRFKNVADFSVLTPKKKQPRKPRKLTVSLTKSGGRNQFGKMTVRHIGGGHKRKYRVIDFLRDKREIPARVASIEYDPNRTAYIALLNYADGEKRYILAPHGLKQGDKVQTSEEPPYSVGCCMKLKHMPLGSTVHAIEMYPGKGAILVRSAGLSAQLMARSDGYATMRMPS